MVVLASANSKRAMRIKHGYDRAGSRTYREQTVDSNSYFDEVYRYDGVDRLAAMDRGPLAAPKTSVSPLKFSQCWGIDATGNWRDFREDADGNGSWDLVQTRTHNGVNEISDISETSGPAWITPLYDRAGNMTRVPKPSDPTQYYSCTYDAWNRLVKVMDGANTVAEYKYDGAKRRIIKKSYTAGSLTETRHLYFSEPSQWQVIEERVGSSTAADRQFVWGLRYVDDLVLRDRNADSNVNTGNYGKSGSGLEERLYAMQDANWNVTALANASGAIQERYAYSAYGTPIFPTSSFGSRASSSYDWESLYCGYRFDTLVGLYHIRHRVYAPALGTWLSRDPIARDANLYRYCANNPTIYVDPSGLVIESVIGPNTHIISWIENTTGANERMNTSANPEPPLDFLGSAATMLPGEQRRSLGSFKSRKEYRNIHELQLTLCCESGRIVTAGKVLHQDVGYTPIRYWVAAQVLGDYSQGRAGTPTVRETQAPRGQTSYKVTSVQRFRLGALTNLAGRWEVGNWAPYAWSRIEYELFCDGTAKIRFGGSYVPSHNFYIEFHRYGQHSMANQPNALKRLDEFIQAGDAKDAPGAERL